MFVIASNDFNHGVARPVVGEEAAQVCCSAGVRRVLWAKSAREAAGAGLGPSGTGGLPVVTSSAVTVTSSRGRGGRALLSPFPLHNQAALSLLLPQNQKYRLTGAWGGVEAAFVLARRGPSEAELGHFRSDFWGDLGEREGGQNDCFFFSYAPGQRTLRAKYLWIEVVLDCTLGIQLSKGRRAGLALVKKRGHERVSPAPFGVVAAVRSCYGCVLGRVWGFSKPIHPYATAGL